MKAVPPADSTLADFTSAQLIVPALRERTTVGTINELNHVLQMNEGLPRNMFATATAVNHELLTSARLGGGMVVVKVRLTTLPQTRFALGIAKEPLSWRAARLPPITVVTLVIEPSAKPAEYKFVVASLNRLAYEIETLRRMREASNAEEILAILARVSFHGR